MLESLIPEAILDDLVREAEHTPPGNWVEVGVYRGGSAKALHDVCHDRELYLYDTFEGLPVSREGIDIHPVGKFRYSDFEAIKAALPRAHVIRGRFPESAVEMGQIAFAHVDCDQYESVSETLGCLRDRMVLNGIIWCDDAPQLKGAELAVRQFLANDLRYIRENRHGKTLLKRVERCWTEDQPYSHPTMDADP